MSVTSATQIDGLLIKEKNVTTEWKEYRKKGTTEMRPYVPGEDTSAVSVSKEDTPGPGGKIARDKTNHADMWFVSKAYFEKNYEEA